VQRENFTHLREAVDAAKEIGLDRISFLAVDVSSGAFNRPEEGAARAAASPLALTEPELDQLRAELDALFLEKGEEFRSGFIAESKEKLERNLYAYFAAVCGKEEFPFSPCNAPWVSAVIEADGTVRPCFFHEPLGNVKETGSLAGVLNSEAAVAFRRGLDVRTNPVCVRCVCRLNLKSEGARW
jgi:radical SAM protein with 4Fe4S-binding SPASM domain